MLRLKLFLIPFVVSTSLLCLSDAVIVTGIAGGRALLHCSVPQGTSTTPVVWLRSSDQLQASLNYVVIGDALSRRILVIGDPEKAEYNLYIKYSRYPEDAGEWTCRCGDKVVQRVTLMLIVRPSVSTPSVNPPGLGALSANSTVYTFICTSHYAVPPVQLQWRKEAGPDVLFDVAPPRVLLSPSTRTLSSSIALVLTARNAGSLFTCLASHPTYMGQVYSTSLNFVRSPDHRAEPLVQAASDAEVRQLTPVQRRTSQSLDQIDKVFVLLFTGVIVVVFVIGLALNKTSKHWQLDVRVPPTSGCTHQQQDKVDDDNNAYRHNDHEITTKLNGSITINGTTPAIHQFAQYRRERKRCVYKMCVGGTLLFLLLFSLIFALPVYYKGITIPRTDTDEMAGVMAGSALWLDCRQFVQPITSLVQITWYHNSDRFYYQYFSNDRNIGYPHNSTKGFMLGFRVTSHGAGHIIVWPMGPDDGGVFSCHVVMADGTAGGTRERTKTTTVFVSMGPVVNYVLICIIVLATLSAVCITALLAFHSTKCSTRSGASDQEKHERT